MAWRAVDVGLVAPLLCQRSCETREILRAARRDLNIVGITLAQVTARVMVRSFGNRPRLQTSPIGKTLVGHRRAFEMPVLHVGSDVAQPISSAEPRSENPAGRTTLLGGFHEGVRRADGTGCVGVTRNP